jgi:hypothetical protein
MSVSINGTGSITGIDQGFNVTTGSVGIGTDNPQSLLSLHQSGGGFEVNANSGSNNARLLSYDRPAGAYREMTFQGLSYGFETSGTERLRITSAGRIGIGMVPHTSSTGYALQIDGGASSFIQIFNDTSGNTVNDGLVIGNDANTAYLVNKENTPLVFRTNNTEQLRLDSNGYLGLNNAAPHNQYYNNLVTGKIAYNHGTNAMMFFTTNGDERLRIDSKGQASLRGTTTAFDGTGAIAALQMYYETDSGQASIGPYSNGGSTHLSFYTNSGGAAATEKLRITSDGIHKITTAGSTNDGTFFSTLTINNTGSNTFSRVRFDRGGVARFGLTLRNDDKLCISNLYQGGSVTANDNAFVMDAYSKIGINEASPTARLDINHPHTEQGLVVRSRYGNIATAMVKFDGDPDSDGGDGNVLHLHGGSSRTDSEILHIDSTGVGDIFDIRGDGLTRVYRHLQLEHASNTAKLIFNEFGANDIKAQIEMDQVNGSNGQLRFYTQGNGTLSERMRITNSGFVTTPNQPCFWATSNTGGSDTSEGYTGIISNQLEAAYVNVGNHYNTSTGIFTCPVAGTYEFHGQGLIRWQGGVGRAELSFYKNGSNTISRSYGYTYVTGASDHDNLHVMGYITCAANDQIDLRVYAMDSGVDCYWGQGLGYFAGRLVQ